MKKILIFIIVVLGGAIALYSLFRDEFSGAQEKLYVAVEGDGVVAVIDTATRGVLTRIDLSLEHDGGTVKFNPHNVQVAPDGKSIWVTANSGAHTGHGSIGIPIARAHGEEEAGIADDQVIVINPATDRIEKRISIGKGIHLAHVVIDRNGDFAYVTAQKQGTLYRVDARIFAVEKIVGVDVAHEPHGLRLMPDGQKVFIAMLGSKSMGVLDLLTRNFVELPVGGAAVQAGITPDGRYAMVSLYDTKQLALYEISSGTLNLVPLPENSKGPIQMYPTPDSKYVYLADQGYYFNQPSSDILYKIDLEQKRVVKEIQSGAAPHGVVVSQDGRFVYVSNLLDGNISVIDIATDMVIDRISVGKEPNGVSLWSRALGGTP